MKFIFQTLIDRLNTSILFLAISFISGKFQTLIDRLNTIYWFPGTLTDIDFKPL